jgi:recombination protein RecR
MSYPNSLRRLIALLAKLPGVGEKTATRLALHMLKMPAPSLRELGELLSRSRKL